jgi:catechol 2,3-dioxygenase-like lactoylglutathione lyase family enzyme
MSYVALVTERYDVVVEFYGQRLGFPVVDQWDRANARGMRFDLGGMRLEILDNQRERRPLQLGDPADRFHVVIEVDDIQRAWKRIKIEAPPVKETSWGARLFQIRDPDGVPVTFLQWIETENESGQTIRGRVVSGEGRGSHFTQLEWARRQFIDKLGIDPHPGTLNLIVESADSESAWDRLKGMPGTEIENPGNAPNDCNARCYPVSVDGKCEAAIVLPEVAKYPTHQIEVIAATEIRGLLDVQDGDSLSLEIKAACGSNDPKRIEA